MISTPSKQFEQGTTTSQKYHHTKMPSLGYLTCTVLLASDSKPFTEYATRYYDSAVETYIAVPDQPSKFCISLKSSAFIASGLAAFVFIDGKYQANRNHRGFTERNRVKYNVLFTGGESVDIIGRPVISAWFFDNVNCGMSCLRDKTNCANLIKSPMMWHRAH
jgi:hypothetical protein